MSVQTRRCFFLFRTISSREVRPVIAKTRNTLFLIDRNKSVQLRGSLRAQALKFPFFLVTFSFGNEREENSARRANTARLRALTRRGDSENVIVMPSSGRARGYVSRNCYCAYAHAKGMGAREYFAAGKISLTSRSDVTHSSPIGDTFPT